MSRPATLLRSLAGIAALAYTAGLAIGTVIHERYQARLP